MNKSTWSGLPSRVAFPVARAGYPMIFASAFTTVVFALLQLMTFALIALIITLFICYFFRDPDRIVPTLEGAVVSPADGKVIHVDTVENSSFYEGTSLKISVFMTVFNVHVNRIPCEGKIRKISYYPGKFFSANLDKASQQNEHNAVFIETGEGKRVCVVQIAGLIARRIICKLQEGDQVTRGQRYGMICFGSRLDIYLPADFKPNVANGDHVKAGTSILGDLS